MKRHVIEQDLPNDGAVSACDYHAALKRDDTMALTEREDPAASDTDGLD